MASDRANCCVPFCRRWRRGSGEFICWDHWKRIPLVRRRAYLRALNERMPREWGQPRKTPRWMGYRPERTIDSCRYARPRNIEAVFRLWDRMKRTAIEKAL